MEAEMSDFLSFTFHTSLLFAAHMTTSDRTGTNIIRVVLEITHRAPYASAEDAHLGLIDWVGV